MRDVASIRTEFRNLLMAGKVNRVTPGEQDPCDTLEILDAQFVASDSTIFGDENPEYAGRELDWYLSQQCNVNSIKPPVPKIWRDIAAEDGSINSNYGWCIFSQANGRQFERCREALAADPRTRQATMIYQRPSMHDDAVAGGMRDFICTYAAQVFVRREAVRGDDGMMVPGLATDQDLGSYVPRLHYTVYMRSNDAVFGYKNDLAWHVFVRNMLLEQLKKGGGPAFRNLRPAPITWNAASLHVYRRHFDLVSW